MFKIGDIVISYTKTYGITNENCVSEVTEIDGKRMRVKIIEDLCPAEGMCVGRVVGREFWVDQDEFVFYNREIDICSAEQLDDFLS